MRVMLVKDLRALRPVDRHAAFVQLSAKVGILPPVAGETLVKAAGAVPIFAVDGKVERPETAVIVAAFQPLGRRPLTVGMAHGDGFQFGIIPTFGGGSRREVVDLAHDQPVARHRIAHIVGDQFRCRNAIHVEKDQTVARGLCRDGIARARQRELFACHLNLPDREIGLRQVVVKPVLHDPDHQLIRLPGLTGQAKDHIAQMRRPPPRERQRANCGILRHGWGERRHVSLRYLRVFLIAAARSGRSANWPSLWRHPH